MKNNAIYIGLGVVALAAVGFFVYRRNQDSAEDMETRSAELGSAMGTSTPSRGQGLGSAAAPPTQTPSSTGVSTSKTPPTSAAPAASNDVLFLAYGISQKDYDKMIAQKTKIEQEATAAQLPQDVQLQVVKKSLADFASQNNISLNGFGAAFAAKNPTAPTTPTTPSAPSAPTRRDCSAEADAAVAGVPRILRGAKRLAYIVKCRAEGGSFDGGDEFAFSFADDTYDVFS